jgi:hypothetical protein
MGQESLTKFSSFQNLASTLIAEIKGKIILLILIYTYLVTDFILKINVIWSMGPCDLACT